MKFDYAQNLVETLGKNLKITEAKTEEELQAKLKEIESHLYKVLLQEPDFTTEEINDCFLASNNGQKKDIKFNFYKKNGIKQEDQQNYKFKDDDLFIFTPPKINEIPSHDQISREKLHREASKILVDSVMKDYQYKLQNEKNSPNSNLQRKTISLLAANNVTYSDFFNMNPEDRVKLLKTHINNAIKVIEEARKITNEQQLLSFMKENIQIINSLNELNYNERMDVYGDFFGEDKNLDFVNDYFNKYGSIANSLVAKLNGDFVYLANPFSVRYNKDDMSLFINYCSNTIADDISTSKNFHGKKNRITNLESPFCLAEDLLQNNCLSEYNKVMGASINIDNSNDFETQYFTDEISMEFSEMFNKEMENKPYFIDLENNTQITNIKQLTEYLINGKNVTMFSHQNKIYELSKPTGSKCLIDKKELEPFIIYDDMVNNNNIHDMGKVEVIINDFLEKMDKVNSFVIFPTKQFSDFVKDLNKLSSLDKNSDEYKKTIDSAAKHAKEYLEVKGHTTKTFTKKTYERIKVAQEFVALFDKSLAYDTAMKNIQKDKKIIPLGTKYSSEKVKKHAENKGVETSKEIANFYIKDNKQKKALADSNDGLNVKSDFSTTKQKTFERASDSIKQQYNNINTYFENLKNGNQFDLNNFKKDFVKLCDDVNNKQKPEFNDFAKKEELSQEKLIIESINNKLAIIGIDGEQLYKETVEQRITNMKQRKVDKQLDLSSGGFSIDIDEIKFEDGPSK